MLMFILSQLSRTPLDSHGSVHSYAPLPLSRSGSSPVFDGCGGGAGEGGGVPVAVCVSV
jgi:hypothetical protein